MNFQEIFSHFMEAFIENAFTYLLFVVPFFVVFWIIWKKNFQSIRIQEVERANSHHFKHDLAHSSSTFFVFAIMDVVLLYLQSQGYTLLYLDINQYGWVWALTSFALLLFINDAFFYWSHRAMHHPKLYNFFHRVHHESTDPSPLTAFAFHPSEAIIENAMPFLLPFVMPLHFGVILAWQVFDMLNNVLAHLGYEAYPKGWVKLPILKYKTASTHHNMHHQLFHGNYALYFTWWDKWMGTEFKDYESRNEQIFERKHIKKTGEGLYLLTVSDIRQEANDAFTIQFGNVPTVFKDFSPGQHLTIKVHIKGETLYRTFSISSIPNTDNMLTLTIKRIKGGKVTNYLAKNLKVGDIVEVTAPSGQFCLYPEPAHQKHYVMIAGGSGITPIYSMIGTILKFEPKSKITLLYANRTSNSIIFKEKLEQWENEYPAQLEIKYFLSEEENPQNAIQGYITRISLEELISRFGKNKLDFYLCGPEIMTNKLIEDLTYLGITKDKIHRELFLISAKNQESSTQQAQVAAKVFGKIYTFETQKGKTILQSGLDQHIPLPFSCQSGLCGMCKMKCTEGKVKMQNNQVLSEQELKAGYILTCQALPQTEKISIQNS
ncbi:MAG: sterol desaturase family protein [Microscillaceae bacterium]|nr:sterol desaturase family protein [Microscillaceae bacterium]